MLKILQKECNTCNTSFCFKFQLAEFPYSFSIWLLHLRVHDAIMELIYMHVNVNAEQALCSNQLPCLKSKCKHQSAAKGIHFVVFSHFAFELKKGQANPVKFMQNYCAKTFKLCSA